jgi:hypothetical protein
LEAWAALFVVVVVYHRIEEMFGGCSLRAIACILDAQCKLRCRLHLASEGYFVVMSRVVLGGQSP